MRIPHPLIHRKLQNIHELIEVLFSSPIIVKAVIEHNIPMNLNVEAISARRCSMKFGSREFMFVLKCNAMPFQALSK